jgi:hypothetical protein
MKKIKDILKRKMVFMHYYGNQTNLGDLELEFIDFVFETPELAEIMRKIILKNKISLDWLKHAFNSYFVTNNVENESKKLKFPLFYNDEIESRFHLKSSFKELLTEEQKALSIEGNFDVKKIEEYSKSYTTNDFYHVKKLYSDIIQEIDLIENRKGKSTVIATELNFDEKKGVLSFLNEEIELSKKGKETDSVLLLKTLLKAEVKEWVHKDEILSDWGYTEADIKRVPRNKVYYAGLKINNAVAIKTKINDFIECNTSKARINPKYKK